MDSVAAVELEVVDGVDGNPKAIRGFQVPLGHIMIEALLVVDDHELSIKMTTMTIMHALWRVTITVTLPTPLWLRLLLSQLQFGRYVVCCLVLV